MYEAKFSKYVTKSHARFAEPEEVVSSLTPLSVKNHASAGAPLYYDDERLYVDDSDMHTITIGPTGCKKSRIVAIPTVESIIAAGESAIINDPKGELYRITSGAARANGAKVYVLNFRKPSCSCGWNPLAQAHKYYQRGNLDASSQCITDFATNVISPILETTADRYWGDTSLGFLIAVMLTMVASMPIEYFNIYNLNQFCFEQNSRVLKNLLEHMDQTSPAAYGLHTLLDLEAEKTKSCVYSTLLSALAPFSQNESLQRLLSTHEIDVETIAEKQTIIYVIYPDEKNSLNFLVNAFFTQCYETLITKATEDNDERLPRRVNFVLDEFSNLPAIPNFSNRISEARSHNVRYFLFVQSFGQLENKYKEEAETILANCGNWICFSSKETGFLRRISEICGQEVDYNGLEHDLISPCEMQHLKKYRDGAEILLLKAGEYPFVTKLPDYAYTDIFSRFDAEPLESIQKSSNAKVITIQQWVSMIHNGTFQFPFPAH